MLAVNGEDLHDTGIIQGLRIPVGIIVSRFREYLALAGGIDSAYYFFWHLKNQVDSHIGRWLE